MNFETYQRLFDEILVASDPEAPYDNPAYMEYVKLNQVRMNRWLKRGKVNDEIAEAMSQISRSQEWIVITEPWCGDAAHAIPFIHKMASLNPLIKIDYELRDAQPFRINGYLTNGAKGIPKLVVRDQEGKDLFSWGPRPMACQELFLQLKAAAVEPSELKAEIQQWYNENEGKDIQLELAALLRSLNG